MNMCSDVTRLDTYDNRTQVDKLVFWDEEIPLYSFEKQHSKQLVDFIQKIISNQQEPSYIKCKSIDFSIKMFLADILKDRNVLYILLDSWQLTDNVQLEILRVKRLALMYPYDNDILSTLIDLAQNDSLVSTESNYQLGLITLFNAREKNSLKEITEILENAYGYFDLASKEENRTDALLFKLVANSIICLFRNNWLEFDRCLSELAHLIFIQQVFSWNHEVSSIHYAIYLKLYNAKLIIKKDTKNWLNYSNEFNQLCMEFYGVQNQSIKSDLFSNEIERNLSDNLIRRVIEPVFKSNFYSTLCKIDCLLGENNIDEQQTTFLKYLKAVIQRQVEPETKESDFFIQSIIKAFPSLPESEGQLFYDAIKNSDFQTISSVLDRIDISDGYDKLVEHIMHSCITLQGTKLYYGLQENPRNKFIAQLLEASGIRTKDQTQWGPSNAGISDGEIDIQIVDNRGTAYSIIEGLILKSLDTAYLNLHLDKIFKYDTTGLRSIFIISYVEVAKFSSFWDKYCEHIKSHHFQYLLTKFQTNVYQEDYADIKTALSLHDRNGNIVSLYHICISMPLPSSTHDKKAKE